MESRILKLFLRLNWVPCRTRTNNKPFNEQQEEVNVAVARTLRSYRQLEPHGAVLLKLLFGMNE